MAGIQNNQSPLPLELPPGIELVKTFRSKRNRVLALRNNRTGEIRVWKQPSQPNQEKWWLEHLDRSHVRVPARTEPLFSLPDASKGIWLEYVTGQPLCEYLEELERSGSPAAKAEEVLDAWLAWVAAFFQASRIADEQWILGDANLRNFLVTDQQRICGLDFEEMRLGCLEENIGEMLFFLLAYDPMFTTWKRMVGQHFVKLATARLALSGSDIETAALTAGVNIQVRRSQPCPQGWKDEIRNILATVG